MGPQHLTGRAVTAYIAVGSNIEPHKNVPAALGMLQQTVKVSAVSTFYRTPAIGRIGQPEFVNGVWRIETNLPVRTLKYTVLRGIESALGRVRSDDRYADRTIDLDVILYGETVLDENGIVLPDPDILCRPFLAVPLLELEPGIALPGTGLRLADHPVALEGGSMEPLRDLTGQLRRMLKK